MPKPSAPKTVETLRHEADKRTNIPTAEYESLVRRSEVDRKRDEAQIDLFSDFNGIPEGADKTEFYQHEPNWSNRLIVGDSLQIMASLAEPRGASAASSSAFASTCLTASSSTPTSSDRLRLNAPRLCLVAY